MKHTISKQALKAMAAADCLNPACEVCHSPSESHGVGIGHAKAPKMSRVSVDALGYTTTTAAHKECAKCQYSAVLVFGVSVDMSGTAKAELFKIKHGRNEYTALVS